MPKSPFESDHQWDMYASNGRGRISGTFKRLFSDPSGDERLLTEVLIAGRWPDRSRELDFYDPPLDFEVRLKQVVVGTSQARSLLQNVSDWQNSRERFSAELCAASDQSLLFSMYKTKGNDFGKDWVRIDYRGTGFDQGAWIMQIDQSCITIFVDEFRNSLESATTQSVAQIKDG